MGTIKTKNKQQTQWQEEKEEEARVSRLLAPCPVHPRLDFSSPLDVLPASWSKAATLSGSVLVPPCTSPPSLSTSRLRSSSLPATPPRTTRRRELCPATSSSPSATTRSSTDF